MTTINIAVIDYPSASKSAVYGFVEVIELASSLCQELQINTQLHAHIIKLEALQSAMNVNVVVLPPCSKDGFFREKSDTLNQYLSTMKKNGATLASACVGSFILAHGGFLDNKFCTTHWRLSQQFEQAFPKAKLNANAIIVNEGDVITAGGRMAWLDLAFEIVSTYCSPSVTATLSKELVIDVGHREQKFYRQFVAKLDHGDELIIKIQNFLEQNYHNSVTLNEVANSHFISSRTLQRRFTKAQGISFIEYLQKLRLHKACQHIELSNKSINEIAYLVGYQNVNAFRKIFTREYGLTPGEYRKRFSQSLVN